MTGDRDDRCTQPVQDPLAGAGYGFSETRGHELRRPGNHGDMQTELQEKRAWLSKERFLDGLALVNMLPGAVGTQQHRRRARHSNGLFCGIRLHYLLLSAFDPGRQSGNRQRPV